MSDAVEEINGRIVRLDEKRSVWLGEHKGSFCFRFTNSDGRKTDIGLSKEAFSALVSLINDSSAGEPIALPVSGQPAIQLHWKIASAEAVTP